MDLATVKKKAEAVGIDTTTMKKLAKTQLIRLVQSREGHSACYGTVSEGCPYVLCCFMVDCYKEAKRAKAKKKPCGESKKTKKK